MSKGTPAGELSDMPPLPETETYGPSDDYSERTKPYFTAQQMREYAQAALAAKDADYALGVSMLTKKIAALTAERDTLRKDAA